MTNNIKNTNKNLTDLQKYVIFENGTEKPFENDYWNNKRAGIYVDIIDGKALFSSNDKFDSNSGWPSFSKAICHDSLKENADYSHNMHRVEVRSNDSDIHLGHVFDDGPIKTGGKRYCINSASLKFIAKEDLEKQGYQEYLKLFENNKSYEKAILAGGCFWGMEDLFSKLNGIVNVINGYTGGNIKNPNYEIVSKGNSNHAEAIEITFDPRKISYQKILKFFFQIHDPTTLNRQGNDIGTQYRSAIFYCNNEQKEVARNLIQQANNSAIFPDKIVTSLEKFDKFYEAEEYHQNYLANNPNGYNCHRIRKDWEL